MAGPAQELLIVGTEPLLPGASKGRKSCGLGQEAELLAGPALHTLAHPPSGARTCSSFI